MDKVEAGIGPLCVTGSEQVPQRALEEAGRLLDVMLTQRGDVSAELRSVGALTAVFGRNEGVCDLPYFSAPLADCFSAPLADCSAQGGLGGVPGNPVTACSERNVLSQPDDPFRRGRPDGENELSAKTCVCMDWQTP